MLIQGLKPDPEHLGRSTILVQHLSRRPWECIRSAVLVGEARQRRLACGEKIILNTILATIFGRCTANPTWIVWNVG